MIHVRTAHNGFIEVYLDGGLVGVSFLVAFIFGMLKKGYDALWAPGYKVSLPIIITIIGLISNNSESSFFRMDMLWFMILLFTTFYEAPQPTVVTTFGRTGQRSTTPLADRSRAAVGDRTVGAAGSIQARHPAFKARG
jgi:O-antigen ligase